MIAFVERNYREAPPRPAAPPAAPAKRVVEMAEAMREILYRDGNVTEQALSGEGFAIAEIIEYQAEAKAWLHGALSEPRRGVDLLTDIAAKALAARAWDIPHPSDDAADRETVRRAWAAYVAAQAAHRLDPWISQSERVIHRLKAFLDLLPIPERSRNRVVTEVAADLKRRMAQ
jgi:hypothetical protein